MNNSQTTVEKAVINLCKPDEQVIAVEPELIEDIYKDYSIDKNNPVFLNYIRVDEDGRHFLLRGSYYRYEFYFDSYTQKKAGKVCRFDFLPKQLDGENKKVFIKSNNAENKKQETWRLYRHSDIIRCLQSGDWLILVAEGEKCVDSLLNINILATTFQSSDWQEESIFAAFAELKAMRKLGGIACFYDNDATGFTHAIQCEKIANQLNIPFKLISPELLKTNPPKNYDIGDWVRENIEDANISDLHQMLLDIIAIAEDIPLERDAIIRNSSDTEKYFIAAIIHACEWMHKANIPANLAIKAKNLLTECVNQIESAMIQEEEIADTFDWYRLQILSGQFPTFQKAKSAYIKVDKYMRIENKYKLEFLIKEIKSNHTKIKFDKLYSAIRDRKDTLAKEEMKQTIDEFFDGDISFKEQIKPILENYPKLGGIEQWEVKKQLSNQFKLHPVQVEKLVESASINNELSVPGWIDGKTFLETEDASDYSLYPQICLAGRVNLLVGATGAGKTSFALDLAASWALEKPFLGELPSKANRPKYVVIINSDQPYFDLKTCCRRSQKVIQCVQQKKLHLMGWISETTSPFTLPFFNELEKNIKELSQTHEILLVIDSLSGINKHKVWSDTDADAASGITLFQSLCSKTGATAIMLHHTPKDQFAKGHLKVRGNSRIAEDSSSVLILDHLRDENTKKITSQWLEVNKMRGCSPHRRDLEHNSDTGEFSLLPGYNTKALHATADLQNDLLKILQKTPDTKYDIDTLMRCFNTNGENRASIEGAFKRLVARRFVQTHFDVNQGKLLYSLTN